MIQAAPDTPDDDVSIPSATVVIFRRSEGGPPELLMVQRAQSMRFAGGAAVFPGGKVDAQDYELSARLTPQADSEVAAARIAGIRETLEETGLAIGLREAVSAGEVARARALLLEQGALAPVLDAFGWTLDPARLVHFAHWRAPVSPAYDTHFFLADIGSGAVDLAVDETECTRLFWVSAARALAMADAGEIGMIYPTRRNLERLAQFDSFDAAQAHALRHPVRRITARVVQRGAEMWLTIPEGLGYPVVAEPVRTARRGFRGALSRG